MDVDRKKADPEDSDWAEAQTALTQAQSMPAGAQRIEALKTAGKMRFYADERRQQLHKLSGEDDR